MKSLFSGLFASFLTMSIYTLGGFDVSLKCLIIVMACDYFTGVASAIYNRKLSSKIGFNGILKKACYLCVIDLAVVLDMLLGKSGLIRTLVIYFFVSNDGISILENVGKLGIPLPAPIKECLDQLKKQTLSNSVSKE